MAVQLVTDLVLDVARAADPRKVAEARAALQTGVAAAKTAAANFTAAVTDAAPAVTALPRAVADGKDIEARANMMAAAAMGATAFQKGLGVVHSLSHPIGALYNTHHGMTNGVFMPYVLEFNRPAIEEKISRLAAWLGFADGFEGFLQAVLALREAIGVPATLSGLGVDHSELERIAAMAIVDPTASGNPVALTLDGARMIFTAAVTGRYPYSNQTSIA